jgi:hypothetical protein
MAQIIIRDNDDAATAIAEMMHGEVDQALDEHPSTPLSEEDGSWAYTMEILCTLLCNPVLYGKLSKGDVDALSTKAERIAIEFGFQNPNDFMFDYEVPEWEKDEAGDGEAESDG